MEGVLHDFGQRLRRHHIVRQTANRCRISLHVKVLPHAEELHEEVSTEFAVKHLGKEVEVGHEGGLENDRNVRRVEQFDRVGSSVPAHSLRCKLQLDTHTLEVDDDEDNDHGRDQLRNVGCVLSVEGLLDRIEFVLLGPQEVEKRNDCSFELGSLLSANSDRREGFPEDDLADVRRDEKRDT